MKIHLLADIHLEMSGGKFNHTPPDCDVVILAGDTASGVAGLVWAAETFDDTPVIMIGGNHEFYNQNRQMPRFYNKLHKKANELGINFLQNEILVIGEVRFVCCTLWTDYNLMGNQTLLMLQTQAITMPNNKRAMNDYNFIKQRGGGTLFPTTVLAEHEKSMKFLTEALATEFDGSTVVVTHHAPSEMSVAPYFKDRGSENAYYASNLHRFIEVMDPTVWVHGHVHSSNDYMIFDTRVISNPRGYVGRFGYNQDFDPNFVFEV